MTVKRSLEAQNPYKHDVETCKEVSLQRSIVGAYSLDWTLPSASSFNMRYFRNCLPISPYLFGAVCGFNRMRHLLIMEGVYLTICAGHYRTGGLGMVVRSLGLPNPLISLLWGTMKSLIYDTPVNSEMDSILVARIFIAAATIRGTPGIFERAASPCHVDVVSV
ncbi:hypothetical protein TNCV_113401 [Trichonephila clavipes]|nr:hypothetical protein TNCV_113401 [Trichonephila clavipes]